MDPSPPPPPQLLTGLACLQAGDPAGARGHFEAVLAVAPDEPNALQLLGATYLAEGNAAKAVGLIQQALGIRPNHVGARINLGAAYFALENYPAAIESFRQTLTLKPDLPAAHYNLGNALYALGQRAEATKHYGEAYRLQPDYPEALALYVHGSAMLCSWSDPESRSALAALAAGDAYTGPPFPLHALIDDPAAHLKASRAHVRRTIKPPQETKPAPSCSPHGKIRLAYVSRDFCQSAVAHLIAGLLEDHDRSKFEVSAISLGADDGSALRQRLERGVDRFIDVSGLSDADAAARIRSIGIDIAIDLNGHTQGNRMAIFAHRPAAIQIAYLGFGGTTGSDFFDYVIVDPIVAPQDQQPYYTEKLWPLPECYLPSDRRRAPVESTYTRAACGLPAEGFVFCSFNNSYKITPQIFEIWMNLLKGVPGSVLWLAQDQADVSKNLRREASVRGVDADRLIFAPKLPSMAAHLSRYRLANLFLDTFPYNAATTASDALWAGLPVLTLSGKTYASRMAGSILRAVGLDELVTTSAADYEARARMLATEPDHLARLRALLAHNKGTFPLFDSDRHRRHLEAAFGAMIEIRRANAQNCPKS